MDLRSWSDIKDLHVKKNIPIQYEDQDESYFVWFAECGDTYYCDIKKTTPKNTDQEDFEDNYKDGANQPINPVDKDHRGFVRSGSRKLEWTTNFTCFGDKITDPQEIYGGKSMSWDFGNTTDDITPPTGFKKKRIEFSFIDEVQLKEGAIYWQNALAGSFFEFMVVCPNGQYYLKNDGTSVQATADTPIAKFAKHSLIGTCEFGDELNSEEASDPIPSSYKFWLDVTVPDSTGYDDFRGHLSIEINRERSIII